MDWGKANRMSKVLKPDGKCFYLAMDHGYFQGPTTRLENVGKAAMPLLEFVDALFVTARRFARPNSSERANPNHSACQRWHQHGRRRPVTRGCDDFR